MFKGIKQADVTKLLDWLIDQGLILQTETTKFRPVVQISGLGKQTMASSSGYEYARRLPARLIDTFSRALRGKKPKLPDPHQPTEEPGDDSIVDLANVSEPIGNADVDHKQPHSESQKPATIQPTASENTNRRIDQAESNRLRPSYYWTWRLMADGYLVDQVQQVRQIDPDTVTEHLIQASENGLEISADWLLSASQLSQIRRFIDENSSIDRATMISRLPNSFTPKQLIYVLQSDNQMDQFDDHAD